MKQHVVLAIFLLPFAFGHSAFASEPRPNVLLIFSNDHAEHAVASGAKVNQTRHLDRLDREGARFKNSLGINSICRPGRATLLVIALSAE